MEKYLVKDVLFGLRNECLNIQRKLNNIDDLLTYDHNQFIVNPSFGTLEKYPSILLNADFNDPKMISIIKHLFNKK